MKDKIKGKKTYVAIGIAVVICIIGVVQQVIGQEILPAKDIVAAKDMLMLLALAFLRSAFTNGNGK